MAEHARRHYAGYEPEITAFKTAMEAALAASGHGWWMLPAPGEPPSAIADNGTVSLFSVCAPADATLLPVPDFILQFPDGVMDRFEGALASGLRKLPGAIADAIPTKPATWPKGVAARNAARAVVLAAATRVKDAMAAAEVAAVAEKR